jgi:hypothetical protein
MVVYQIDPDLSRIEFRFIDRKAGLGLERYVWAFGGNESDGEVPPKLRRRLKRRVLAP